MDLKQRSLLPVTFMTRTLVNLTLPIVKEEAALLAEHFPDAAYQDVLDNADLEQELIAYVLSRIPNTYAFQEGIDIDHSRGRTTAYRLRIEALLQQGILHVLAHFPTQEVLWNRCAAIGLTCPLSL